MDATTVEQNASSCDHRVFDADRDLEQGQATKEEDCATISSGSSTSSEGNHCAIGKSGMSCYGTAMLLVCDVLGTGILSLPYVVPTLGWVATMIAIPVFGCLSHYSAWLLARIKAKHPEFKSYANASTELIGPLFGQFTRVCLFLYWGLLGIYNLVGAADGIGTILDTGFLSCSVNRTILAAIILIIPAQCRNFHAISKYLSLPALLCLLVALCITIFMEIKVNRDEGSSFGENTRPFPSHDATFYQILPALSTLLFAYEGHSIYLEFMSEMKDSRQFPKSNAAATTVICFFYFTVVFLAYGFGGDAVPGFLPAILKSGAVKIVVGILVLVKITVGYVIVCQPIHASIHLAVFGKSPDDESTGKVGFRWFLVTFAFVAFACIIANLVPFVADLQGLIGGLLGAGAIFLWPPLLFFFHHRQEADGSWKAALVRMGWKHVIGSCIFLVISPLFLLVGTTGSMMTIFRNAEALGIPYACWLS